MALIKNTMTFFIIGHQRYKYNGREGFYLNCVDDYPPSDNGDTVGCSQQSVFAPYSESKKIEGVQLGLFEPAMIEIVPSTISRKGTTVLVAESVIGIKPFSEWSKSVKQPQTTAAQTAPAPK